jgi:hypothetical protein
MKLYIIILSSTTLHEGRVWWTTDATEADSFTRFIGTDARKISMYNPKMQEHCTLTAVHPDKSKHLVQL